MNQSVIKSKKFIAAVLSAISGLLTFVSSKFGLGLNVEETMTMVMVVVTPFLIYIGAEGYSERDAKKVEAEKQISDIEKFLEIKTDNKTKKEDII